MDHELDRMLTPVKVNHEDRAARAALATYLDENSLHHDAEENRTHRGGSPSMAKVAIKTPSRKETDPAEVAAISKKSTAGRTNTSARSGRRDGRTARRPTVMPSEFLRVKSDAASSSSNRI